MNIPTGLEEEMISSIKDYRYWLLKKDDKTHYNTQIMNIDFHLAFWLIFKG